MFLQDKKFNLLTNEICIKQSLNIVTFPCDMITMASDQLLLFPVIKPFRKLVRANLA